MRNLEKRVERLEAESHQGEAGHLGEALRHLSGEDLDALEEELLAEARARGERPPPNRLLEEISAREAEHEERVRASAEESRRRDRELVAHNRALAGLPPLENDE